MRFAALLATALPLLANGQAQLLPAGEFAARDGRPGPGKTWKLDDAAGTALAATLNAIAQRTPISIDYEHQTMLARSNGQPAPAAGWITAVDWRAGEGLFAQVNWTERARGHINANEYRYISPVIVYDAAGHVVGLHNAALVSVPAIVGMEPVVAALAALIEHPPATKDPVMDRKLLAAALGLAVTSGQYPFVAPWLTAKLAGLLLYIVLGALALRPGRPKWLRALAFAAALTTVAWVVSVALTRQPAGFFATLGATAAPQAAAPSMHQYCVILSFAHQS